VLEQTTLPAVPADVGDERLLQADGLLLHLQGAQRFQEAVGLPAGVDHEEGQLVVVARCLEQAADGVQVARRLGGEAGHEPADAFAERLDTAAGPEHTVVEHGDLVVDALDFVQQVGRKEDGSLAAGGVGSGRFMLMLL
jgi:hypothetical protein